MPPLPLPLPPLTPAGLPHINDIKRAQMGEEAPIEDIENSTGEHFFSQAPGMGTHPQAGEMGKLARLTPPPGSQLPPPPSIADKKPGLLQKLLPFLPTIAGGVMGVIGGPDSAMGQFGGGGARSSSNLLLDMAAQKRKQDAEKEENRMRNVGGRIDKMRRLAAENPQYADVVRLYDEALEDGSFSAKEASKLQELMDSMPDPEGMLQEADLRRKTDEMIRLKGVEDRLKRSGYVDTPYGRMDPDDWARAQVSLAGQQAAGDRAEAAEAGRERRFQEGQDRSDARFWAAQDRLRETFGTKQDTAFQGKMDNYYAAEEALANIEGAMKRYQDTSLLSPMKKALAANALNAYANGLSTIIGRNLGERGVFTDQDRATFRQIITPGLLLTEVAREEAEKRLNDLRSLLARVKAREIDAYKRVNPNSKLDLSQGGLPPPPLPPKEQRVVGQKYIMKDGKEATWNGQGFD